MDKIVTLDNLARFIENTKELILNKIYPVGSVYISTNDINPKSIFGGEWEQIKDRFLLAAGDIWGGGVIGGEETTKLTRTQLPYIGGQFTMHHAAISTNISNVDGCFTTDTLNYGKYKNGGDELSGANSIGRVIFDNGGKDEAHNNMPPYLTVYMWKRIS